MTAAEIMQALEASKEVIKKTQRIRKGKGFFVRETLFLDENPLSKYDFDSVKHLLIKVENKTSPFEHYKLKP